MNYQVTGNEYISLPAIRETDGAAENISFLYMGVKGMLEMYGQDGFLIPYAEKNGKTLSFAPRWSRDRFWIPAWRDETENVAFRCVYLAPIGERGFLIHLEAENTGTDKAELRIGLHGDWARTLHTVNESIELTEGKNRKESGWNHMFVFSQTPGAPLFAFAPITEDHQAFSEYSQDAEWTLDGFRFDIFRKKTVTGGEKMKLTVFFGIGYEEVAAAASAKEMLRKGYEALYQSSVHWLDARRKRLSDRNLSEKLNTNLFFAFFFASGRTIDTEELCMMTSRSPRYYVSAAYWDRDSLLWAFPAICEADSDYARELLLSVYGRQGRNFGIHSRYIDGTVLEPGFELDELCAPVIALKHYTDQTGDWQIVNEPPVRTRLNDILRKLEKQKHPSVSLYSTFLQPTDDMHNYPYLTYDNALVWYTLKALAGLLERPELEAAAEKVRDAVQQNCTVLSNGKRVFAWSTNLNGKWDIYDEPPGSLLLLPFYGFCDAEDEVWKNTEALIRSEDYPLSFAGHPIAEIGCKHAAHPWLLSICNSLLSGHSESALKHLQKTNLDNGIACESINEDTGACETGEAFATCAGFFAFALNEALSR